ncbi:MAG TPA: bacillithiol system redox-active protein YtxJ [Rhodothermales bacterium]|nr:bacillithiol system redox-active protein YtxJ [Rhodothermales bacterium]
MVDFDGFVRLDEEGHLDSLDARSFEEPVVIYKHSTTCTLSSWARDEMGAFVRESGLPVYQVVVQHARPLSNAIAERYGIRHESPQVILLFRGMPQFHASHRRVTAEAVQQALSEVAGQESGVSEEPY